MKKQRDPTREGALLDLISTNKPGLLNSVNTIPGISDHDIIVLDADLKAERTKKAPHKVYQWDKENWEQMKQCTKVFATKYLTEAHSRNTKTNYQVIENHLCNMMTVHVPSKFTRTRTDLPWMTNNLKRMCKRKHYNRAKQKKSTESWNRYKETQKQTKTALRRAQCSYMNSMLERALEEGDHKPLWKYCKSQRQDNIGVAPLKENGQLHSDSQKRSEILAYQFKLVFTQDGQDPRKDDVLEGPAYPPINELAISEAGVHKRLTTQQVQTRFHAGS